MFQITHKGTVGFFIAALTEDGKYNLEGMQANLSEQVASDEAHAATDFATVAAEVNSFLLDNPGLKTITFSVLERNVWDRRVEGGALKGKTREEKDALAARFAEVLPNYIRATKDRFHVGKKTGVAIYFVEGEVAKDKEGNPTYDGTTGNEVQAYRHTAEDWKKMTEKKALAESDSAPASK